MNGRTNIAVDGTAALKFEPKPMRVDSRSLGITAVRGGKHAKPYGTKASQPLSGIKAAAITVLEASEMYCSLRYEDIRGCAYGVFTKRGIATLSSASAVIGALSIALSL